MVISADIFAVLLRYFWSSIGNLIIILGYMRNLKIICQGNVCKIDKPPSLSIKTLKNMTPGKDENGIFFFKFEILTTNIG